MSNRNLVLAALAQHGTSTYGELEQRTGLERNKLRWTCADLKGIKSITQVEAAVGNEIAWKITPVGQQALIKGTPSNSSETTQAGSGDVTPAAAHRPPRVAGSRKRTAPPAEGAANVIEAAKRDKTPAAPASDPPGLIGIDYRGMLMQIADTVGYPEGRILTDLPAFVADQCRQRGKTIRIEPCPFCQHDDVEIDEIRIGQFSVDCPECEAIGPIKDSEMEAIDAWNKRSAA